MSADITLTDLFEVEMLQRMQDAFSKMTGFAAIITDANGKPVTKGSNFTDFCQNYSRRSPLGCVRCEQCDKHGAELALKAGTSITYYCHAGLIDFAAPIMAGNQMIGCFVGGQVLTEPPDITKLMQVASEIDVELINYLQAALKVRVMDKAKVEAAAYFLYTLTDILSSIAYHKYEMHQANIEIEKVANLKSDFLANMSHEIRTPMNAVIGMAELALREDLEPTAKDYITQIKSSGKTLLTIINDILDFSKIESGKMSLTPANYEPITMLSEVINLINTRVNKDVEFITDINPDIPAQLFGDSIRIKQVLTNICGNAAKFTNKGFIKLKVDFKQRSSKTIDLLFSVEDSGIGIKPEETGKLFTSFHQVNSKRNRNIEGTGLGLAISKSLVNMMGGDISVQSEYGTGSIFSFHVEQKIIDKAPAVSRDIEKDYFCLSLIKNKYLESCLREIMEHLQAGYTPCTTLSQVTKKSSKRDCFCFFEEENFSLECQEFVREHENITAVVISSYDTNVTYPISNAVLCKKPLSIMSVLSSIDEHNANSDSGAEQDAYDYIAPNASILIVDDNAINLTVVEGLLRPVQIQMERALSGKEALEKISDHQFDLIFMDHMMPDIDGIETTHLIRRFHKNYENVPIIALTANAVENVKEMFLKEGLNDFIPKPIELKQLLATLKQWLPEDKIESVDSNAIQVTRQKPSRLSIEGLDTQVAIRLLGSESLFWSVLKDYYHAIPKKIALIKEYEQTGRIKDYTIEVHALKSASKQIGATQISMQAFELEMAGNERNLKKIHEQTDAMLKEYFKYYKLLKPYFANEQDANEEEKEPLSDEIFVDITQRLTKALDDLDMDGMEECAGEYQNYALSSDDDGFLCELQKAVESLDTEKCEEILNKWKEHKKCVL